MTNLYSIYTENPTETSTTFYSEDILSPYVSENITESINNNTLISSINSMVTFQNKLNQEYVNVKELPNEILLRIFNYLDNMSDILNLRCVNKKFKSLSEVKLYDIIEEKIETLESKKKSLERRLSHMKNHLCPRLSHYKVFLNVISRSDVSELCNLPKPPREVKYIFSVLYILYTGGKNCRCLQCLQNKNTLNHNSHSNLNNVSNNSNNSSCSCSYNYNTNKKSPTRSSFSMSDLSTRTCSSYDSGNDSGSNSLNGSSNNSRRNSIDSISTMNFKSRKNSVQSETINNTTLLDKKKNEMSPSNTPSSSVVVATTSNTTNDTNNDNSIKNKPKETEEEIEIPNWEEVRQVINKNDFRNWIMNLHSKLDVVPKEHILLANNLLNKPRATTNSKNSSNNDNCVVSEYENLRLTYDRMLIVSQIGYKVLLFIEAIIQSFFLTERFEEQKNSISLVYKQIHQWKDLQLQCKI